MTSCEISYASRCRNPASLPNIDVNFLSNLSGLENLTGFLFYNLISRPPDFFSSAFTACRIGGISAPPRILGTEARIVQLIKPYRFRSTINQPIENDETLLISSG